MTLILVQNAQTARIHFFELFTSRLTSFLTNHFTHITYTFTLVRLRLTQATDFRGYLPDELLIDPFQADLGVFPFILLST